MRKMIQIRDVPEALHLRLKSGAALAGMSLSDYLLKKGSLEFRVGGAASARRLGARHRLEPQPIGPPVAIVAGDA
jgi:hypothetical protein